MISHLTCGRSETSPIPDLPQRRHGHPLRPCRRTHPCLESGKNAPRGDSGRHLLGVGRTAEGSPFPKDIVNHHGTVGDRCPLAFPTPDIYYPFLNSPSRQEDNP